MSSNGSVQGTELDLQVQSQSSLPRTTPPLTLSPPPSTLERNSPPAPSSSSQQPPATSSGRPSFAPPKPAPRGRAALSLSASALFDTEPINTSAPAFDHHLPFHHSTAPGSDVDSVPSHRRGDSPPPPVRPIVTSYSGHHMPSFSRASIEHLTRKDAPVPKIPPYYPPQQVPLGPAQPHGIASNHNNPQARARALNSSLESPLDSGHFDSPPGQHGGGDMSTSSSSNDYFPPPSSSWGSQQTIPTGSQDSANGGGQPPYPPRPYPSHQSVPYRTVSVVAGISTPSIPILSTKSNQQLGPLPPPDELDELFEEDDDYLGPPDDGALEMLDDDVEYNPSGGGQTSKRSNKSSSNASSNTTKQPRNSRKRKSPTDGGASQGAGVAPRGPDGKRIFTGIRQSTTIPILPIDAPIQARTYKTESRTSRKAVPVSIARTIPGGRERTSSIGAGGGGDDSKPRLAPAPPIAGSPVPIAVAAVNAVEAAGSPSPGAAGGGLEIDDATLSLVERKRRANTIAARVSRERKAAHVANLEGQVAEKEARIEELLKVVQEKDEELDRTKKMLDAMQGRLRAAGVI